MSRKVHSLTFIAVAALIIAITAPHHCEGASLKVGSSYVSCAGSNPVKSTAAREWFQNQRRLVDKTANKQIRCTSGGACTCVTYGSLTDEDTLHGKKQDGTIGSVELSVSWGGPVSAYHSFTNCIVWDSNGKLRESKYSKNCGRFYLK
jgi:hypothetical protein